MLKFIVCSCRMIEKGHSNLRGWALEVRRDGVRLRVLSCFCAHSLKQVSVYDAVPSGTITENQAVLLKSAGRHAKGNIRQR